MSKNFRKIIYRGVGEEMNLDDGWFMFDCRRDAHEKYPSPSDWDHEVWENMSIHDGSIEAVAALDEVDQRFCQKGAMSEDWWKWLMETRDENFPSAKVIIWRGRWDSNYTTVILDNDKLAMMFKQAFQGT